MNSTPIESAVSAKVDDDAIGTPETRCVAAADAANARSPYSAMRQPPTLSAPALLHRNEAIVGHRLNPVNAFSMPISTRSKTRLRSSAALLLRLRLATNQASCGHAKQVTSITAKMCHPAPRGINAAENIDAPRSHVGTRTR